MNRRKFIDILFFGSLVGTISSLSYPIIRYLLPPKKAGGAVNSVVAARVDEVPPNSYKIFKFGSAPGILINTPQGELRAFSAVCTHLSCNVTYDAQAENIYCPCHNGRFDLNGNVLAGPPPKPLEQYEVKISGQEVIVSRRA
jgi:Rieske Fe-S protein